jgi:hypothetical protein
MFPDGIAARVSVIDGINDGWFWSSVHIVSMVSVVPVGANPMVVSVQNEAGAGWFH